MADLAYTTPSRCKHPVRHELGACRTLLLMVFDLQEQDRQILLPGPSLTRHIKILLTRLPRNRESETPIPVTTIPLTGASAEPNPPQPVTQDLSFARRFPDSMLTCSTRLFSKEPLFVRS